jgi:hypothetical protein
MRKNKRNSPLQKGLSCLGLIILFNCWLISLLGAIAWAAVLTVSCKGDFPCPHPEIVVQQLMVAGIELIVTIAVFWGMVALSKLF